jgi:hypothetical protein
LSSVVPPAAIRVAPKQLVAVSLFALEPPLLPTLVFLFALGVAFLAPVANVAIVDRIELDLAVIAEAMTAAEFPDGFEPPALDALDFRTFHCDRFLQIRFCQKRGALTRPRLGITI